MAIYHCSIKIIGRGGSRNHGHSAVESAAYRSGTKLENEWSGQTADYSRKKGVVYSEIMLPTNASDSFLDRETLWNSVEMNEKRRDAQLARDIEVSLPKELTLSEHKEIMHDFCQQFVDAGMCVDMNIHDKGDGNPHCHIMLTMRGLDENGKWLPKSHQEFELDENGERIRQTNGRWKSRKVNTVDWSNPENAERWRVSWAETVNRYLEQNGIEERIDHRSNAARGLDEIPSIHMGPAACAMKKKGIHTERGDINRQIRAANRIIKDIRAKIGELKLWLSALSDAMKEIMEEAKAPNLTDLLTQYIEMEQRRVQKYSGAVRLKYHVSLYEGVEKSIEELNAKGIHTLDDLEAALAEVKDKSFTLNRSVKGKETRMKELQKLMDMGRQYQQNAPIRKQYNSIKREKKKEAFAEERRAELSLWNAANRYLHAKHIAPDSLPEKLKEWQMELADLSAAHKEQLEEMKECREEVKKLDAVHRQVEKALAPEQEQQQGKKKNMEL